MPTMMMTSTTSTHGDEDKHDSEDGRLSLLVYSTFITRMIVSSFFYIEGIPKETKVVVSRCPAMFDQHLQWDTFSAEHAG